LKLTAVGFNIAQNKKYYKNYDSINVFRLGHRHCLYGKNFPDLAVLNAALYCSFHPVLAFKADCFKTRSLALAITMLSIN